jgi:hypothetical protein
MVDALQAVTEEDFTVAELKSVAEVAVVQLSLLSAIFEPSRVRVCV